MSDIVDDKRLSYAEKIAKLLGKAESTDSEAEADALNAKAQQLMITWSVSEGLLAQARGRKIEEKIVAERITYTGIFHRALFSIGWAITRNNDCRGFIYKYNNSTDLSVIGYESDVRNVKLLDASLQIQASTAMQRWYRTQDTRRMSNMDKFKLRREFLFGFANGLAGKLAQARRAGLDEATTVETRRTGDAAAAKTSTDLVLRSKRERVDEWVDNRYGTSTRKVRGSYAFGGTLAREAGRQAGRTANIGQPGVGGGTRELGR